MGRRREKEKRPVGSGSWRVGVGKKRREEKTPAARLETMGFWFSKFLQLFGEKEARILVLGLDNAGKTTILYRLQVGEVVSTIPTIGFNVETVSFKNIKFQVGWPLRLSSLLPSFALSLSLSLFLSLSFDFIFCWLLTRPSPSSSCS